MLRLGCEWPPSSKLSFCKALPASSAQQQFGKSTCAECQGVQDAACCQGGKGSRSMANNVSAVKTLFVEVLLIFSVMKHQLVTARRRVRKSLEADLD